MQKHQITPSTQKNTTNTVSSARASSLPSPPSKEGGGQFEIAVANVLEPWAL